MIHGYQNVPCDRCGKNLSLEEIEKNLGEEMICNKCFLKERIESRAMTALNDKKQARFA